MLNALIVLVARFTQNLMSIKHRHDNVVETMAQVRHYCILIPMLLQTK